MWCSYCVHKRKQVCTKGGNFLILTCVLHFVHTLCFMPSQISVVPHVHCTKWASFLSKAPIMNWKKSHCGLGAASQVLLAPFCNSLLHWSPKFVNLCIFIILKVIYIYIYIYIYILLKCYFLSCGQICVGEREFFHEVEFCINSLSGQLIVAGYTVLILYNTCTEYGLTWPLQRQLSSGKAYIFTKFWGYKAFN